MSAPDRPKRELLPLGGTARSAKGAPLIAPGCPKRELLPLGGTAHSTKDEPIGAAWPPQGADDSTHSRPDAGRMQLPTTALQRRGKALPALLAGPGEVTR